MVFSLSIGTRFHNLDPGRKSRGLARRLKASDTASPSSRQPPDSARHRGLLGNAHLTMESCDQEHVPLS